MFKVQMSTMCVCSWCSGTFCLSITCIAQNSDIFGPVQGDFGICSLRSARVRLREDLFLYHMPLLYCCAELRAGAWDLLVQVSWSDQTLRVSS